MKQYIEELNRQLSTGRAGEHSYRPALEALLKRLLPANCLPTNEPARIECGAPDFIITRGGVPVSYIECKDLDDADLDGHRAKGGHKEQFDRYKAALGTVVFTDYLDFHLYREGELVMQVRIAEVKTMRNAQCVIRNYGGQEALDTFAQLVNELATAGAQPCKTAQELAKIMAGKARLMTQIIRGAFANTTHSPDASPTQMEIEYGAFRKMLIHDLTTDQFADIYAQTIAYGLFAARLHWNDANNTVGANNYSPSHSTHSPLQSASGGTFCRQTAAFLIPPTNPTLRQMFISIAAQNLDGRVAWAVDSLADAFGATDVPRLMAQYEAKGEDPMMHFYEDFLSAYDPATRKQRGVWYTPPAVVGFIVRAADYLLEKELGVRRGLAADVQILDPAAGTGTFIIEVIRAIKQKFAGQPGLWKTYAASNLLPRLTGFEVLMASYAIAHLKVERELADIKTAAGQRTQILLTNSLEKPSETDTLPFAFWLTEEAREASRIKSESRVMVVLGNPPYNISSANKNEWINRLLGDYKKDLNEKKINLDDDYIKFIRLGQEYILRNGEGVLAYICNNSFLEGLIHRQMRKCLLETFDDIYIINLHGNARLKEMTPDGGKDENVFDIMAGVSINIFVKKTCSSNLAIVRYKELWGKRNDKYNWLDSHNLADTDWQVITPSTPQYYFAPKDFSLVEEYERGVLLTDLFVAYNSGIETQKDDASIFFDSKSFNGRLAEYKNLSEIELRNKYNYKDSRDWNFWRGVLDVRKNKILTTSINYRPFDVRNCFYTGKGRGIIACPRFDVMQHMIDGQNIALIAKRGFANPLAAPGFVTANIIDRRVWTSPGMQGAESLFPLWLAPEEGGLISGERRTNLRPEAVAKFAAAIGREPAPEEMLQYVYGVLYTPEYRQKYAEFLKVDFPRIPLPNAECGIRNAELSAEEFFDKMAAFGKRLIDLHLLRFGETGDMTFPAEGDNTITEIRFVGANNYSPDNDYSPSDTSATNTGRVYINETQYFAGVPKEVWEYYIGGYQPMQKWLKDRKGRALEFEDIRHYMKMGAAIKGTIKVVA